MNSPDRKTLFADLLIPVPVNQRFTYRVPATMNDLVQVGQRAVVPFGQRKILTGVIAALHESPPEGYEAKYILELLDAGPIITAAQFKLYEWMASYYMCTPGEVLQAALPAGLKLSSESVIQLHPAFDFEDDRFDFSEKEQLLLANLRQQAFTYSEAARLLGVSTIYSLLKSLASKEAIVIVEEIQDRYKPRLEKRIRLTDKYLVAEELESLFEKLAKKPSQESLLLKYLQVVPVLQQKEVNEKGIARTALLEDGQSASSLQTLITKGVLESFDIAIPRFQEVAATQQPPQLTSTQEKARDEIVGHFNNTGKALLFGVTGSGKTEIYIDLIRKTLDNGDQVLYLLPEIALTTQIVNRLRAVFGNLVGVYHSKFSDNERVEVWNGVLDGTFRFIVGVRSSVFLPFDNLGLIIVDEEHDPSYKQQDPAPRYHARDTAHMMAQHHHAHLLLGSATPSTESYFQSKNGRIGLVQLMERFGEAQLPEIVFADLRKERRQKTVKGDFTSLLLREITETLKKKNQVILFQNRRGHSPLIQCEDCGWVPRCINCAVSLTYHQYRHAMVCHYCGYREALPSECPQCQSKRILTLGYGTEKLEEEIQLFFPEAHVDRMDLDTTRSKSGYEQIIGGFEAGNTDILVGTQMVTKGLDFNKVQLVGIFNADRMMHYPDFRAYERAFQLMVQVSGRAGRRNERGKVVIQTSDSTHWLFGYVAKHAVIEFLDRELADRAANGYPPYSRLIEISFRHADRERCLATAERFAQAIRQDKKGKIKGPAQPLISRVRNEYVFSILVKLPRNQATLSEFRERLLQEADRFKSDKTLRTVRILFDPDPS